MQKEVHEWVLLVVVIASSLAMIMEEKQEWVHIMKKLSNRSPYFSGIKFYWIYSFFCMPRVAAPYYMSIF